MMTAPIAIYRPRTGTLLLASADGAIVVDRDRIARLVGALRKVTSMIGPRSTLRIHNAGGEVVVDGADLPALCDAIDDAIAIPARAAALLAEPIGG